MYGRKGQNIVEMNNKAVDRSLEALVQIEVPATWGMAVDDTIEDPDLPYFVEHIQTPMARHEGDELPVSAFIGMGRRDFSNGNDCI